MENQSEIELTDSALKRIIELRTQHQNHGKFLRLTVQGGGCSGFQYIFALDNQELPQDIKIKTIAVESKNEELIAATDETSLDFLRGAKIDFVEELGASYFKVINPNASSNCGCGSSFAI